MIYKVLYQENSVVAPRREMTQSLFIDASSRREVIHYLAENTPYLIESVSEISQEHLEYEKENHPEFKIEKI